MISRHPNTHSQFWRNHCLELRCLATNVSLILFRLSLERVADNVMIEQGMFYRTRETLQSPRPINNLVIWKQSLSIAVLKCRAFRPSFPKTPHTPPVTGAWRRWSPKPLLHYSIQSFISSISILIFLHSCLLWYKITISGVSSSWSRWRDAMTTGLSISYKYNMNKELDTDW